MKTIIEAKDFLAENWEDGVCCPCCNQFVKRYKRKLTTTMSLGLIDLFRKADGNPRTAVHIKEISNVNGGEFAQMKRWGLIMDEENTDDSKRTSGRWHITEKGVLFAKNEIEVPAYVYTYNGETLKFSEEVINISGALGRRFNYHELMEGYVKPLKVIKI